MNIINISFSNMKTWIASWLIILLTFVNYSEELSRNKVCYQAKTCIHTGKEKCGVDSAGNVRRFLDSCDIMEYNCLKGTDYKKSPYSKCVYQPPINEQIDVFNHTIKKHNSDGDELKRTNLNLKINVDKSTTIDDDGNVTNDETTIHDQTTEGVTNDETTSDVTIDDSETVITVSSTTDIDMNLQYEDDKSEESDNSVSPLEEERRK